MSIDYTLLVQMALFVALWLVLKRLWFDAALRVIRERTARSEGAVREARAIHAEAERLRAEHAAALDQAKGEAQRDRKSTRLNSSHEWNSYAVFCCEKNT